MEPKKPIVEVQMLIRKPVSQVFQAFIDPAITTHFWFTKSSGPLEVGKVVTWEWEMYGASTAVWTKEIIVDQFISTEWGVPATTVDYAFTAFNKESTYVVIRNYGFLEAGDELIEVVKDSTGGFTTVLDGLKAYLEYQLRLNLIADKYPPRLSPG